MADVEKLGTEKEEKKLDLPANTAQTKEAASTKLDDCHQAQQDAALHKKRTTGNKIFDWAVYGSIAWGGVCAMSLFVAHQAKYGHPDSYLRKGLDWFTGIVKGGLKRTIMRPPTGAAATPKAMADYEKKLSDWAEGTGQYYALGFGGTALVPAVKYLEDNRLKLSGKIDNALGTTPPDPDAIAKEPKQSWKSVLSGRAFSVIAVGYSSFVAMGPTYAKQISEWFGEWGTKAWMKMRPGADRVKVRQWADLAVFDALFTTITASAMYAFSRFVAKRDCKDQDTEGLLMTIDPATPTPLNPMASTAPEKSYAKSIKPREKPQAMPEGLYTAKVSAEAEQSANHQLAP